MQGTQSLQIDRTKNVIIKPTISEQVQRKKRTNFSDYLNLNFQHDLGEGTAGKVVKVFDHTEKKQKAIKIYTSQEYYEQEKQILESILQLPMNLPPIFQHNKDQLESIISNQTSFVPTGYRFRDDLSLTGDNKISYALIMDVYQGNLLQYLQYLGANYYKRSLEASLQERKRIAKLVIAKIFLCVYHLHRNGYYHCDISLDNFLVNIDTDGQMNVYVNDFNHSKREEFAVLTHEKVSGKHFPPEIVLTSGSTCKIVTPTHTLHARRLDYFALYSCFCSILQLFSLQNSLDNQLLRILDFFFISQDPVSDEIMKDIFNIDGKTVFEEPMVQELGDRWEINLGSEDLYEFLIMIQDTNPQIGQISQEEKQKGIVEFKIEFKYQQNKFAQTISQDSTQIEVEETKDNSQRNGQLTMTTSEQKSDFYIQLIPTHNILIFRNESEGLEQEFFEFKALICSILVDNIVEITYEMNQIQQQNNQQ